MPFRHPKAHDEILLGNQGDGIAGQHNGAGGQRNLQHAAGSRRQHVALGELLLDHRALRGTRPHRIGRDVGRGARLVQPCLWRDSLLEQIFSPRQIDLRLSDLGFKSGDLRVERLHLQRKLVVTDGGNDLAEVDMVALLDRDGGNGAADPAAARDNAPAFDRRKHRLLVGHGGRCDDEDLFSCAQRRHAGNQDDAQERADRRQRQCLSTLEEHGTAAPDCFNH